MPRIDLGYVPRGGQAELHRALTNRNVIVCHRRFGKTTFAVNTLIQESLKSKKSAPRFHYLAPTYKQAKMIAWDYTKQYSHKLPNVKFNESELKVEYHNGARLQLVGGDNPDALRGIYSDGIVLDELDQTKPYLWTDVISPALMDRGGWAIRMGTFSGRGPLYEAYEAAKGRENHYAKIVKASESGVFTESELQEIRESIGEVAYLREFECDPDVELEGALWSRDLIENTRILPENTPEMQRIVIAVDPAVSSDKDSSETGIVVGGVDHEGHGHVLDDLSFHGTPGEVAKRVSKLYHLWHADRVVGEVNNGGEWIGHAIYQADPNISYKAIRASRGKAARAEPITALYERGKVHHNDIFADLEMQMCSWEPLSGSKSPDRLDALVWCMTELMLNRGERKQMRIAGF